MIPCAEIFTKRSGGPFDISFSDENQNRKPYEPTTNSIKTTTIVRQQFRLRANAERRKPNQSFGKLVEASGTRRSRAASKAGANAGGLAAHFRHHRHRDLWNSCRRAIWSVIFILVCFQMTTTLRPIIAPSKTFLPTEKKFFLAHWFETVNAPNQPKR